MEQKAEELYEDTWCTFQTTFFGRWMGVLVLKYTETGNVLETIRRFWKAVSELEDTVQTNNNGQLQ